jgi:hypothetical protein
MDLACKSTPQYNCTTQNPYHRRSPPLLSLASLVWQVRQDPKAYYTSLLQSGQWAPESIAELLLASDEFYQNPR